MFIGLLTVPFGNQSLEHVPTFAKDSGFSAVEIDTNVGGPPGKRMARTHCGVDEITDQGRPGRTEVPVVVSLPHFAHLGRAAVQTREDSPEPPIGSAE